jgi:hypothetical protein
MASQVKAVKKLLCIPGFRVVRLSGLDQYRPRHKMLPPVYKRRWVLPPLAERV